MACARINVRCFPLVRLNKCFGYVPAYIASEVAAISKDTLFVRLSELLPVLSRGFRARV